MAKGKRVEVAGEHLVHRHFWHGAETLKRLGDEHRVGRVYPHLAASLFLYFAFQAFLNYVGPQIAPEVWADERARFGQGEYRGTQGKLDFLLDKLGLKYTKAKRPYSTVVDLDRGRDRIVHPRSESIKKRVPRKTGGVDLAEAEIYRLAKSRFYSIAKTDIDHICSDILASAEPLLEHGKAGNHSAFRGGLTWQVGWSG